MSSKYRSDDENKENRSNINLSHIQEIRIDQIPDGLNKNVVYGTSSPRISSTKTVSNSNKSGLTTTNSVGILFGPKLGRG